MFVAIFSISELIINALLYFLYSYTLGGYNLRGSVMQAVFPVMYRAYMGQVLLQAFLVFIIVKFLPMKYALIFLCSIASFYLCFLFAFREAELREVVGTMMLSFSGRGLGLGLGVAISVLLTLVIFHEVPAFSRIHNLR